MIDSSFSHHEVSNLQTQAQAGAAVWEVWEVGRARVQGVVCFRWVIC
jgi:hypothetical protein